MEGLYRVDIFSSFGSSSYIESGFLKCIATQTNHPFSHREFAYCLHCRKLRSIPWFYRHKRKKGFEPSPQMICWFHQKFDTYVRDIFTELECLSDMGKLFPLDHETVPRLPINDVPRCQPTVTSTVGQEQFVICESIGDDISDATFQNDDVELDSTLQNDRLAHCISECFEEFCFDGTTFDLKRFASLSNTFFGPDGIRNGMSLNSCESVKPKVLSRLMRKVFVMFSLSKKQMDVLNKFVKAVLVFSNPDLLTFARKIHSGYFSCLRESFRQKDSTEVYLQSCFESCEKYSIALDTALFGQDHVLACSILFAFSDSLEHLPLFFSVCDASTGQELASFVMNRLKRMDAPLSKLVSLSTDGARNMMGHTNGLFACFKRLFQQEIGTMTCSLVQVWCVSHRLNLVIRDFQNVDNIKSVLHFCDWLTQKRKAVAYRKFLREKHSEKRLRKIPKPSETRWSFYRDVLESLLKQTDEVEEFLTNDGDFISMRGRLFDCAEVGVHGWSGFFSNDFILSHFLFAFVILEKISDVNEILQRQYMTLPEAWHLINRLKETSREYYNQMRTGRFDNFEFIAPLNAEQKKTFEVVIQNLLLNMEVRFSCPSTCIDSKLAEQNFDFSTNTLNKPFLQNVRNKCPLFLVIGIFQFPEDFFKERKSTNISCLAISLRSFEY